MASVAAVSVSTSHLQRLARCKVTCRHGEAHSAQKWMPAFRMALPSTSNLPTSPPDATTLQLWQNYYSSVCGRLSTPSHVDIAPNYNASCTIGYQPIAISLRVLIVPARRFCFLVFSAQPSEPLFVARPTVLFSVCSHSS